MHQIRRTLGLSVLPSADLYQIVRAGFVAQGTTLNAWCTAQGVNRQTAARALSGERNGRRSRELRDRLVAAAGLSGADAA